MMRRSSHIDLEVKAFHHIQLEEQRRLYQMYGTNPTDQLYLAVLAKQIGEGLEQQIEGFVREHSGTKLVIIDTLQKVRSGKCAARNEYAADYEAMGPLKQLADQLGICIMMVESRMLMIPSTLYPAQTASTEVWTEHSCSSDPVVKHPQREPLMSPAEM